MTDVCLSVGVPRVSIGVPVYNGERFLADALESLINQTFGDTEIIICDNASTDATAAIAQSYAARDPRIRYVRNAENVGAARNFNRCLALARGEFFRWASADDVAAPSLVQRCVRVLDEHPDVVQVYGRTTIIDENGKELRKYDDHLHTLSDSPRERYLHILRHLGLVNALYGLMRTDVLRRTQGHASYLGADLVMQEELALYGKIWEIPDYLFFRRMHAEAHSAMSLEEKKTFYNPQETVNNVNLYHWRHLWERLASVRRAPLSLSDRLLLSWRLIRGALSNRKEFGKELGVALKMSLRRAGHG